MTIPSSGPVSMNTFSVEFGKQTGVARAITEFYGAASGVPASGTIPFSHMLGKSNRGEVVFTGDTNWTVPNGVTSICFVAVGKGANGLDPFTSQGPYSGAGGNLGWKNNVAVSPGWVIQIRFNYAMGGGWYGTLVLINGTSYIAGNGNAQLPGNNLGPWDSIKNGGSGYGQWEAGGGGAGGYEDNGGYGGYNNQYGGGSVSGGGGGGGHNGINTGSGGGVGLLGIISGAAPGGAAGVGGGGGQGGNNGNNNYGTPVGGAYGGGGAGSVGPSYPSKGGQGAVRIIWGAGRSYPRNAT